LPMFWFIPQYVEFDMTFRHTKDNISL
jgi:hypothetical protein